ncbi:AAA family ATPase [Chryseobacterium caseinilyticum]|uniref:AAA family ATPase n=1 Tax=Chryseobacterium caseinilyticum TaxID=2771428 RepID=A0ABR8ZBJ0_9FLAO|nr:AAA family ATPase [Chryseobacterium caseinilyticum]MBD8082608.1 AAA family ATPase [Chryseobacterium caseinilyticum]
MNKIKKVLIKKFWGDKTVEIDFDKDINFLIGVNGSGKTTIINLIAATLCADFKTLDLTQFQSIEITLYPKDAVEKDLNAVIKVEKKGREFSPFPEITFSLKSYDSKRFKTYNLEDLEEDNYYRYRNDYIIRDKLVNPRSFSNDINFELESLVNVSWLTIHRMSNRKRKGTRNFESTIDEKIEDLQIDLVKYFSQLNRLYSNETEKFQKYIFESLLDTANATNIITKSKVNSSKEKESLDSIFKYFKISTTSYSKKLDTFFSEYEKSYAKLTNIEKSSSGLDLRDFAYLLGTVKIHSVIEEWNKINEKQKQINKTKETFLQVINSLLQRKSIYINERNELVVETQSGKSFSLFNLSSGEKQLLIIFGQSLLQDENPHIYIADEPELSLHIEWQEKLVKNLKNLNPNSQIIFATHSPDIVAEYDDKVLKIESLIN